MNTLILNLAEKGILIDVVNGDLIVNAPAGTLNDELINAIKENKPALVRYLSEDNNAAHIDRIEPVAPQSSYSLSSSQKRLWVLSQFKEGNTAYNMSGAYTFEGNLDFAALRNAFNELIARHESLRTVFKKDEQGEVKQFIIAPSATGFVLVCEDFMNQEEMVKKAVHAASVKPFDLANGPLIRANLYQVAANKWVFTYTMHHIISDGWSMGVLIRELLQLYNANINGKENPLAPLRIQYKDYAGWQQQQLSSESLVKHKLFWMKQFEGEVPALELKTDKPRPVLKTYNGDNIHTTISKDVLLSLKAMCQEQGGTLFMGLMAVVNALLYKYTSQEDITIGRVVAGRNHNDLEGQIGFYTNTLALRTLFKGTDSFRELLDNVKQLNVAAYEHQAYPFDELVNELGVKTNAGRSPLFDVMMELRDLEMENDYSAAGMGGIKVGSYESNKRTFSKFDLTFFFSESANGLNVMLEYNSDLFSRTTADRLSLHLAQLLRSATENPDTAINKLTYINAIEAQLLINDFNATETAYAQDQTVLTLFEQQVLSAPDSIALETGSCTLTYKELDQKSNQLANYLLETCNIQANDLVGIMQDRSENVIISILGILKAGAAYVPIDPAYPQARKEYILNDTGIRLLLTQMDYMYNLGNYQGDTFAVDIQLDTLNTAMELSRVVVQPANLAYIIYTSGSTGNPKGCMLTHANLYHYIRWANGYYFKPSETSGFSLFTSLSFDLTVTSIFCAITRGSKLYIYNQHEELPAILQHSFSAESGIDSIKLTPSHINLLEHLNIISTTMMRAIVGGEEVTPRHVNILKQINPSIEVYNEYGPTETTVGCVVTELQKDASVLIGQPIANTKIYVLDKSNECCGIGVPGELYISGNGVANGYLNNEKLTAERFMADPFVQGARMYKTGDLGRWLDDGSLEFMGRIDEQVKINGYRVELGEVENVLLKHDAVEDAVVLARKNGDGNPEMVAYYTSGKDSGNRARIIAENKANGLPEGAKLYELPGNLDMYAYNNTELKFLYDEVFKDKCYLKYGVTMPENACIIDIGANIGMFSVFAAMQARGAKIYSFEPLPPTFELLKLNASLYPGNFNLFNIGIADKEETVEFTFFPNATVLSSRYAEGNDIMDIVKQTITNKERLAEEETTEDEIDMLLKDRLKVNTFPCKLKTLSQIIRENNIERIDYLKIDVEKSELDVLNGIEEQDWKKIRQIVLEIHDFDGRKDIMLNMLSAHGFRVQINQSAYLKNTGLYDVYAISEEMLNEQLLNTTSDQMPEMQWHEVVDTKNNIRNFLKVQLPAYMIPARFIQVDKIPLTRNGKVDRKLLAEMEGDGMETTVAYVAPRNETDERLVAIWQEILNKDKIGIRDSFFDLGGNSLKAMRLIAKINKEFDMDQSLDALFNQPTIEAVANEIEGTNWVNLSMEESNLIDDTEIFSI